MPPLPLWPLQGACKQRVQNQHYHCKQLMCVVLRLSVSCLIAAYGKLCLDCCLISACQIVLVLPADCWSLLSSGHIQSMSMSVANMVLFVLCGTLSCTPFGAYSTQTGGQGACCGAQALLFTACMHTLCTYSKLDPI